MFSITRARNISKEITVMVFNEIAIETLHEIEETLENIYRPSERKYIISRINRKITKDIVSEVFNKILPQVKGILKENDSNIIDDEVLDEIIDAEVNRISKDLCKVILKNDFKI